MLLSCLLHPGVFCLSSSQNSKELQTCVNKMETDSAIILPSSTLVRFREIRKYLKRRLRYSSSHPGSFNPAIITNQEAHMIYGNMDEKRTRRKEVEEKELFQRFLIFFLRQIPFHSLPVSLIIVIETNYSYVVDGKTTNINTGFRQFFELF